MTRDEWVVHWRNFRIQERENRPKISLSSKSINSVLKELYGYMYLPKQNVFINLISRYENKLDRDFVKDAKEKIERWKPQAKDRAHEIFRSLIYSKNPLLELVKKDESKGVSFPVPIKYD